MISKHWFRGLIVAALGLPIAVLVTAAVGRLLAAVGDHGGAMMLDRTALLGLVGWILSLVGLVIGMALNHVVRPDDEEIE